MCVGGFAVLGTVHQLAAEMGRSTAVARRFLTLRGVPYEADASGVQWFSTYALGRAIVRDFMPDEDPDDPDTYFKLLHLYAGARRRALLAELASLGRALVLGPPDRTPTKEPEPQPPD